jgi:hypothetical protein
MDSRDRTAQIGQPGWKEKRGWPQHDGKDRTAPTRPSGQEKRDMCGRTGQPGQNSWDRIAGASHHGQVIHDRQKG